MTDGKRLKRIIEESGFKVTALCAKTGINRQFLYKKLKGEYEFTASEIQALCDELHLTAKQRNEIFFAREVAGEPTS
jgi:transcriptional regulator with XRE-family HTH domain